MVPGNMSLHNNHINMTVPEHRNYLDNNRAPVPLMSNKTTTGLETIGRLQGKQTINNQYEFNRNQADRMDIQTALKGNPYALSMAGGI
jgi:N-formylglutamate amidohydrolase